MKKIKYLVTNGGEGSICIAGRQRLEIPGKCVDLEIYLPDITAKATISRLKQRYPLLSFKEAQENEGAETQAPHPEASEPEAETQAPPARSSRRKGAPEQESAENAPDTGEAGNGN